MWKDDRCVAFLSINPLADGHVLVVPRQEVDHWIDADPDLLAHLVIVAQVIGQALDEEFGRARVGLRSSGWRCPTSTSTWSPFDRMGDSTSPRPTLRPTRRTWTRSPTASGQPSAGPATPRSRSAPCRSGPTVKLGTCERVRKVAVGYVRPGDG